MRETAMKKAVSRLIDMQKVPIVTSMQASIALHRGAMPECSDNRFLKSDYGQSQHCSEKMVCESHALQSSLRVNESGSRVSGMKVRRLPGKGVSA
jgi:hypothetical protein